MRYFLELAYFGKAFHGWQRQPNALSVQEVVENALSTMLQEKIEITGAGRTDAGVHAEQIFAHFDVGRALQDQFIFRLNALLPKDIAAVNIFKVHEAAHARFDALNRSYEYRVVTRKDVFAIDSAYHVQRALNLNAMNLAAGILKDYSNFKCFSRSRTDVKTYNCKIDHAYWEEKEGKLFFRIKADRFLRNMVRAIVGTLLEVGLEKIEVQQLHEIIKSGNRSEAGASVPAHGLFLTGVEYPESIFV